MLEKITAPKCASLHLRAVGYVRVNVKLSLSVMLDIANIIIYFKYLSAISNLIVNISDV